MTHQKGDLDAGHTFGVEEGNLMLYIPFVEPEALPGDPEIDATEEIPALEMDNADLAEPDAEAGGTPETDIPEIEDGGDVGSGTYIPGEEEAPDYDDPVNNMPDPVYTPESAIPDEDTAKIPKGISYLLEDGELKIVMGLGDVLSAWATVYNTEPDEQLDFKYDENGLRVQKVYTTINAVETTDYILHGKLITHLIKKRVPSSGTATTEQLHFFYDKNSRPAMVEYNNTLYYYRHNLQGDIVEIVDGNGNVMVNYTYDAWGTPTGIEGTLKTTLGELNPFRYRGYVWDAESGLYYLRNRYYNPMRGRFINADLYIVSESGIGESNLFVYCINRPVNAYDPDGKRYIDALSQESETQNQRAQSFKYTRQVRSKSFFSKVLDVLKSSKSVEQFTYQTQTKKGGIGITMTKTIITIPDNLTGDFYADMDLKDIGEDGVNGVVSYALGFNGIISPISTITSGFQGINEWNCRQQYSEARQKAKANHSGIIIIHTDIVSDCIRVPSVNMTQIYEWNENIHSNIF